VVGVPDFPLKQVCEIREAEPSGTANQAVQQSECAFGNALRNGIDKFCHWNELLVFRFHCGNSSSSRTLCKSDANVKMSQGKRDPPPAPQICETACMMTNHSIDFRQLAEWQESATRNRALIRVLQESAQETLAGKVTPLAAAFHEASVAAVYQQFGFSVFSPESRRLLAISQSRHTRIASHTILDWLDQAAYQQLADFHVLRYLDAEPDWLELSHTFCVSVIKRIVVCRPQEWQAVGLEHYPRELLEMLLRVADLQMLGMRQQAEILPGFEMLLRAQGDHPLLSELLQSSLEQWGHAIDLVLARVAQEPLSLLAWRLEAFTTERQLQNDARLAVQTVSPEEVESTALKVIVMIAALSGFEFGQEKAVVAETPVTFSHLTKALEGFVALQTEPARMAALLLNCGVSRHKLIQEIEMTLAVGEQLGVFKWVTLAKNQKAVLLTSLAMQVIEPYRELIESSFGRGEPHSHVPC